MPFQMTPYLQSQVLNLVLNGTSFTPPAAVYLALFTALNEAADGVTYTEVPTGLGNGYGRVNLTFNAFAAGVATNSVLFDFPVALADWGSINHFGIFDASSGGNLLYWGETNGGTPVSVLNGQQFEVAAGQLSVDITGTLSAYLANKIGEHTLRGNAFTPPSHLYLAILTAFTNDTTYTELVDANYARQSITFSTATAITPALVQNSNTVTFPGPVNAYTANYLALFDAVSSGNLLLRGPASPPKSVTAATPFVFPPNNLTVTAD